MDLKSRYEDLWQRLGCFGEPNESYEDLVQRYSEPHRAYHTLCHVEHGLVQIDLISNWTEFPDLLEWAWWYHDAVCKPGYADNEEKSAELSMRNAQKASFTPMAKQRTYGMIMATRHLPEFHSYDTQLIVDVDLTIFGESPVKFDEYERQIRIEYNFVPDDVFNKKRAEILQRFLTRRRIYRTTFLRELYESQARLNLERSIARLKG